MTAGCPTRSWAALLPDGFAHSLAEFGASGMWALDLRQHRATLYVGTTKVVDLHLRGGSFALSTSPRFTTQANGWDRPGRSCYRPIYLGTASVGVPGRSAEPPGALAGELPDKGLRVGPV